MLGLNLTVAFGLLVLERRLAATDLEELPEARALSMMARLPILAASLSSAVVVLASAGYPWAVYLLGLLLCLLGLVAIEFMLRAALSMFRGEDDAREPPLLARSVVAGLLSWPPRPMTALQQELRSRHGIDLRQIWALEFIRKTFPKVAFGIACIGWLTTGAFEVPISGRAIYEQFGRPVAVLQPGLHLRLPWPFDRVVPVENGVVHELATTIAAGEPGPLPTAEGPAPKEANRLWDGTHLAETSEIIASPSGGKDSFQVVNMDVRFVYRVGLSDEAAMQAAYRGGDLKQLIESTASRVLVREFAARTLDDTLGESRIHIADEISTELKKDLDHLHVGVEVLAVVVEAIHPPAGAANAYHSVQAAEIQAQAAVARERGFASQRANAAELVAATRRDEASATASEIVAASKVAGLKFGAERQGYETAGQAFLSEAYFSRLATGLRRAKTLIVDHRIETDAAPTFDLRDVLKPLDPGTTGRSDSPRNEEKSK